MPPSGGWRHSSFGAAGLGVSPPGRCDIELRLPASIAADDDARPTRGGRPASACGSRAVLRGAAARYKFRASWARARCAAARGDDALELAHVAYQARTSEGFPRPNALLRLRV